MKTRPYVETREAFFVGVHIVCREYFKNVFTLIYNMVINRNYQEVVSGNPDSSVEKVSG
jgi:hypothetical protein